MRKDSPRLRIKGDSKNATDFMRIMYADDSKNATDFDSKNATDFRLHYAFSAQNALYDCSSLIFVQEDSHKLTFIMN